MPEAGGQTSQRIFQLSYTSRPSRAFSNQELVDMLKVYREKNKQINVTGTLIYKDSSFMQILEGDREVVLSLYQRIAADDRHIDVRKQSEHFVAIRHFSGWWMSFCNAEELGDAEKKKLQPYFVEKFWQMLGRDPAPVEDLRRDLTETG